VGGKVKKGLDKAQEEIGLIGKSWVLGAGMLSLANRCGDMHRQYPQYRMGTETVLCIPDM
jgi:hypothetical protein